MKKNNIPKEYYTCHFTNQLFHYTEFVLAKKGWLAIDNTRRHPISKKGKTINQALTNGLRMYVDGVLLSIGNKKHPFNSVYQKNIEDIRKENNYNIKWLRCDLTKEAFLRTYNDLNITPPDLENLCLRGNRKSNMESSCLDFLGIPNEERKYRQVKVGKYYIDGFIPNNIAVEFLGDYHHANPEKYKCFDKILNSTAEQKWKKDAERFDTIEQRGYNIIKIWESDWVNFITKKCKKLKIHYNRKVYEITCKEDIIKMCK